MWKFFAGSILRYKLVYLFVLSAITAFMAYQANQIEMSYDFVRPLPKTDEAMIEYENFKKLFGEDGTIMVMGFQSDNIFTLPIFNGWYDLTSKIKTISGIRNVLSVANLYNLEINDSLKKFKANPLIKEKPATIEELDSLRRKIMTLPFYKGLIFNETGDVTLMMVTFEKKDLNSARRIEIIHEIKALVVQFEKSNKVEVHFSGMPYIRTQYMEKVSHEMKLFMILAILLTALVLFLIFKSFRIVAYSMVVVIVGIIWSLGTLQLLGYKITILTGLIPSIITVIGLPNCVFIINKYQVELGIHRNKVKAIFRSVYKVGFSNFLANITTAIGFGVFIFTKSSLLVEFGLVAAINVMTTYFVAHILVPIILSYLPQPTIKQTRHLTGKVINDVLNFIDNLVHNHRKAIYISLSVLTIIGCVGMNKIKLIGYMVDDLPKKDPIYADLHFFEKNFKGVLPFEISIDTKKENGIFRNNAAVLYKMKALQNEISDFPELSKPVSAVEAIKFSYQAYRNGKEKFYMLPDIFELKKLIDYSASLHGNEGKFSSFVDSTKRYARVSYQMADVGSVKMKVLLNKIRPKVDSIFNPRDFQVLLTGNSLVYLKGNDYLYHHLFISLFIAIGLILLIGLVLFRSVLIIVLSKLPCLIPLALTAGIMGFANIPFKPSTILVFSIAFGLSSDGTIYILAEYWNQLRSKSNNGHANAVSNTIKEVGVSMIYTAAILFVGFAIFSISSFGGTVALGILMSITIAVSLCTNLILLPSIILSLEKMKEGKKIK